VFLFRLQPPISSNGAPAYSLVFGYATTSV
jgi:hypothetical protein